MSTRMDPVRSLERIEAWMVRYHPDRLPLFRPAVDPHSVARIEARLGVQIPHEVLALYTAHDGQPEGAPSLCLNQRWLPLDLVRLTWEDMCLRHSAVTVSAGQRSWSQHWLPLFGSFRGDHYCIDLSLTRHSHAGPVIWFLYDEPERTVIASSIGDLLGRIADGVESDRWHLDEGYDGLSD
jgi:cell wall assembly regulator SMI1